MKLVYWPIVLNLVGTVSALFYGIGGGSGGETTQGVFLMFWITGWLTILLALVLLARLLLQKSAGFSDVALLVVMVLVGFLETRLILSNAMALRSLFG